MGILDDAIREHLDLKRKHGARDAELREIEDEALGSAERPDAFTAGELFGEGAAEAVSSIPSEPAVGGEEPTRVVEPTAMPPDAAGSEPADEAPGVPEELPPIPGQEEIPEEIPGQENLLDPDAPGGSPADEPLEGYRPVEEQPRPEESQSADLPEPPATSESLEELIAEEEPFPEDAAAPPPPPETVDRPGAASEVEPPEPAPEPPEPEPEELEPPPEPESSVPDPPPPPPETGPEPPGRARGRVDVPTQEHPPPGDTGDLPPVSSGELRPEPLDQVDLSAGVDEALPADTEAEPGAPALYDFETDEDPVASPGGPAVEDDFDALGPAEEEAPYLEEEEPYAEEPVSTPLEEPGTAVRPAVEDEDEEPLEEGAPGEAARYEEEDSEDLWFEKGPPKDFDFDD